jgi:hypothetical protein
MATASASAAPVTKGQADRHCNALFLNTDPPEIPAQMAELLEKYSAIPVGNAQITHVQRLRDRAYREYQYPCLGLYGFLGLALSSHPLYNAHVLPLLCGEKDIQDTKVQASSPILLDLGTCLGQDVRKLLFDGAPLDSVYGADLLTKFIDIGYDLFRDEEKLPRSHFVAPADIFDPSSRLKEFDEKADIIHANSVFHLFSWDDQVKAAKRVVKLMRPQKGSLILGSQVGHKDPGEVESRPGRRSGTMFRHDANTWERLWETVGKESGLSFTVRSTLVPHPLTKGNEEAHEGFYRMTFEIWRE